MCGPPVTVIYELTERGQALIPTLDLIAAWARDTFRPAIADSNARPPLAFDTVRTHWHHGSLPVGRFDFAMANR